MSLVTDVMNLLKDQWRDEDNLTGEVANSLDELRERLPPTQSSGEVQDDGYFGIKDIKVYSQNTLSDKKQQVAYECNKKCDGIVIGPPKMEASVTNTEVKYSCTNCDTKLGALTLKWR